MTTSYNPNTVWLVDDNNDYTNTFKNRSQARETAAFGAQATLLEALKQGKLPDVVAVDVCLSDQDEEIVRLKKRSFKDFAALGHVEGIQVLCYLRTHYPNVPVLALSGYYEDPTQEIADGGHPNPGLAQHALAYINKPDIAAGPNVLPVLLWISQQAIIGVRLLVGKDLEAQAKEIIEQINTRQNHFYYVLITETNELSTPPEDSAHVDENAPLDVLFEIWNLRVFGIIDDIATGQGQEKQSLPPLPVLPFGRRPLRRFPCCLTDAIKYMGEAHFASFLIRECARAAYSVFFDMEAHPLDTGKCLFDSSSYFPSLLYGIRLGTLCEKCLKRVASHNADGGWSAGRDKAAQTIVKMAQEYAAEEENCNA